jgi:hypothetical protein
MITYWLFGGMIGLWVATAAWAIALSVMAHRDLKRAR